jgi:hypothetical protein
MVVLVVLVDAASSAEAALSAVEAVLLPQAVMGRAIARERVRAIAFFVNFFMLHYSFLRKLLLFLEHFSGTFVGPRHTTENQNESSGSPFQEKAGSQTASRNISCDTYLVLEIFESSLEIRAQQDIHMGSMCIIISIAQRFAMTLSPFDS